MTFDNLWNEFCNQQPRLKEGSEQITFSIPAFRMLLQQVYDRGKADFIQEKGLGYLPPGFKKA